MSERTTSSSWASGIVQALELGGVDCRQLFARLGLDYAALSDPDARFPQDGMTRLWHLAVETSGNPAIGLNMASVVRPSSFHVVGYALMSSRNLLEGFNRLVRYQRIIAEPNANWAPRTVIFAGKAASAYRTAKLIIKLINDVATRINHDPRVAGLLKVVSVPNYGVSAAEILIPGANLSEQISTAGTEASGTGNMKFALNGALTIGTLDGANVEMGEQVGDDNIFIFGLTTPEVARLRQDGYRPATYLERDPALRLVLNAIGDGTFSPDDPGRFRPLVDSLVNGDQYLLLADFASYIACQRRVDEAWRNSDDWNRRAILNVAGMGVFSSDRTIREYADEIWHVKPLKK